MSGVRKRSVSIRGHRTSFSLEDEFHDELTRLASETGQPLAAVIATIDEARPRDWSLSSAIRIHVLRALKA